MTLPPLPDTHALAVLALVVLALYLFSRERIAIETSSLFILVLLTSGFAAFPYVTAQGEHLEAVDFFSGFGDDYRDYQAKVPMLLPRTFRSAYRTDN